MKNTQLLHVSMHVLATQHVLGYVASAQFFVHHVQLSDVLHWCVKASGIVDGNFPHWCPKPIAF